MPMIAGPAGPEVALENPCEICWEREGYTVIDEPICALCRERRLDRAYDRAKESSNV